MARTALSMTRLAEALDDQTFQISALTKRINELEQQKDLDPSLSSDTYIGRSNVKCLNDRISKLERENTALSNSLQRERKSYESTYRDLVLRIRALEEECSVIGEVPTGLGQSPAGARKYRKYQVHKQIDDMIKGMARLQELIGPED